jgi:hypothetical protein
MGNYLSKEEKPVDSTIQETDSGSENDWESFLDKYGTQIGENEMIKKYFDFISTLKNKGKLISDISQLEVFQTFRKENAITFKDASLIDLHFTGYSGERWTSAFNYPKTSVFNIKYNCKVGILTF